MSYECTPFEEAFQGWLEPLSGVLLIFANMDAAAPPSTYATMLVIEEREIGEPMTQLTDEPLDGDYCEVASQLYDVTVRVTTLGKDAHRVMQDIRKAWALPTNQDKAQEAGFTPYDIGTSRRVPQPLDQITQDRWVMDFFVYTRTTAQVAQKAVESIGVKVDVQTIGGV